jgi:hypothetical protein
MNYPEQILPRPNLKCISEDISQYFITRKYKPLRPADSQSSLLPEEMLGLESASDCFDYSTNLIGIFEAAFNKIELIGDNKKLLRSYWDFQTEIKTPVFEEDFVNEENIKWFFLHIGKINNHKIPFKKTDNSQTEEQAHAIVVHTPTNCNFWHCSVRWKEGENFISTNNSKWKNKVIAAVRSFLSEAIEWTCPQQEIPQEFYSTN